MVVVAPAVGAAAVVVAWHQGAFVEKDHRETISCQQHWHCWMQVLVVELEVAADHTSPELGLNGMADWKSRDPVESVCSEAQSRLQH